ncbi:hypothetical protein KDK_52300 [Dictyobacter kobayashii]|uniref:Uncharacterized protein n=1 Tax=Dictyobacter kobayashii TaxID=2014872 RepID=A0A402AQQ6_9CHLR|nr:hypothetical protein [Dictyobacter kobayashii]GCE21430.1 hypothetical protein KDK_52300 [Dictyobacter kobayashii]
MSVEEGEALRRQVQESGLLLQVGTMKRFDPGIAFAHQFIQEEMGQLLALKAWYCDSTYRYIETDNLQPIIVTSAHARRPEGNPRLTNNVTIYWDMAAILSIRPASWVARSCASRPGWSKSSGPTAGLWTLSSLMAALVTLT